MEKIKYSILIPVYNIEVYLPECLDSVIHQTYPYYEAIVKDDGSTDRSGFICDTYAGKDARIKVYHQENKGLMMTRKEGILKARGEYCLFLDSDDYYDVYLLEKIDAFLKKNACDVVIFNKYILYKEKAKKCPDFGIHKNICSREKAVTKLFEGSNLFSIFIKAVKRELIINDLEEIYVPINYCEDVLQTLHFFMRAERLGILNEYLYYYRIRKTSLIHTMSVPKIREILDAERHILNCMQTCGMDLKMQIWSYEGYILNNFMESVFKLNSEPASYRLHIKYLQEILLLKEFQKINTKANRKRIKRYNLLRLHFLMSGHFALLLAVDKGLYFVKGILQLIRKEKGFV